MVAGRSFPQRLDMFIKGRLHRGFLFLRQRQQARVATVACGVHAPHLRFLVTVAALRSSSVIQRPQRPSVMSRRSSAPRRVSGSGVPSATAHGCWAVAAAAHLGRLGRGTEPSCSARGWPTGRCFPSLAGGTTVVARAPNTSFQGTAGLLRSPAAPELHIR